MLEKIREHKGYFFLGLIAVWYGLAKIFFGKLTLELPMADNTSITSVVNRASDAISGNRTTSPLFIYFFNPIRLFINGFVDLFRGWLSTPMNGASAPAIGWAGVIAIMAFAAYATSRIRIAILVVSLLVLCGALGMWTYAMDTIAMTLAAVLLSLLIGAFLSFVTRNVPSLFNESKLLSISIYNIVFLSII